MLKAAIVLLADAETREGAGRMANALTTVKEFKDAGDDAILDFAARRPAGCRNSRTPATSTTACCRMSATRCRERASTAPAPTASRTPSKPPASPLLDEYHGHPRVRDLMLAGRQVVTF